MSFKCFLHDWRVPHEKLFIHFFFDSSLSSAAIMKGLVTKMFLSETSFWLCACMKVSNVSGLGRNLLESAQFWLCVIMSTNLNRKTYTLLLLHQHKLIVTDWYANLSDSNLIYTTGLEPTTRGHIFKFRVHYKSCTIKYEVRCTTFCN